jgi:hypothetical protein
MLFVPWVVDPFRPTRDLDLLGHGDNNAEAIAGAFRAICAEPVADDGVTATIAGARVPIQVDRTSTWEPSSSRMTVLTEVLPPPCSEFRIAAQQPRCYRCGWRCPGCNPGHGSG